MTEPAARPGVRLAELLAVLSLAADLGMGQPMEHALIDGTAPAAEGGGADGPGAGPA